MKNRTTKQVIADLKVHVNSEGFIYSLCLIIMDDFHFDVDKTNEIDNQSKLSKNEVMLLLGLMIKKPISFTKPNTPSKLFENRNKTYELMTELHRSTMTPYVDKIQPLINNPREKHHLSKKDFFSGKDLFIEPIFYSGDGIFDFQYLEFLERKYKYDEKWLLENRNFEFEKVIRITQKLKDLHVENIKKINFLGLKNNQSKFIEDFKKDNKSTKKDQTEEIEDFLESLEIFQYFELFETDKNLKKGLSPEQITKHGWSSFYDGLINLFCISPSDFTNNIDISNYLNNFSVSAKSTGLNKQFKEIGDFNLLTSKPIIEIDKSKYFVPMSFSIFEAVYESPYYWMLEDESYLNVLAENRGKVGEEITVELLIKVFGKNRVFPSVRIESKKGFDDTDIDVLCVLGSKALCVQVKSKKLTQISRKGDFKQLQKDFKGAVQDAYEQGLVCRDRILDNTATFYNEKNQIIKLSEAIEEVYILGITTENYPSLTHQSFALLEKEEDAPHPLILTVFDLDLVLHYQNNPYDFLYYVRQRIRLMDYFYANEEAHFLGYHLIHKLWRNPDYDTIQLDNEFGQLIFKNYYLHKLGIEPPSKKDVIKEKLKPSDFKTLCSQIGDLMSPMVTDILFHLLDWSEESRNNLINQIHKTKEQTTFDRKWHNFSIIAGPERSTFGLTYISWDDSNVDELMNTLLKLCRARKYKSKADKWVGLGCLKNSGRFVDVAVYNDTIWEFDEFMEVETKEMFSGGPKPRKIKLGKKPGRNDPCPCASEKKYKNCCGRRK